EPSFKDLVPANHFLAFGLDNFFHALLEIALYFFHRLELLLLHQRFYRIALFPEVLGAFVAADMDIAKGKEGSQLGEHLVEEGIDLFIGGAQRVVDERGEPAAFMPVHDLFARTYMVFIGAFGAGEFGIGYDGREAMTGYVHFGEDVDKTVFRVLNDLADIILCVEAAIGAGFIGGRIGEGAKAADTRGAPGAYFREPRQALDLYTPAFVIGEVHVQDIKLILHHLVDKALH